MIVLRQTIGHLRRHVRNVTSNIPVNEFVSEKESPSLKRSEYIVWMDLEMTGLDPEKDKILELACLITDGHLKTVSEDFQIVINQPDEELNRMDSWCTNHHGLSGLTDACKASTLSIKDAEFRLLSFLKSYVPINTCPLAGNSIYMDRIFLLKHMPLINAYLHYRMIDVSSLKELARRWERDLYKNRPQKCFSHRALTDLKESINELKYYREHLFNNRFS